MIRQAVDRDELHRYVEAMRGRLDDPSLQEKAAAAATAAFGVGGEPVAKLREALPPVAPGLASSGGRTVETVPFMSRDPIQSLLQSTLEDKLRERGVPEETAKHRGLLAEIVHFIKSILHPVRFGPEDPEWVLDIAASVLDRLALGNHAFNTVPAEHNIADNARLVIVGDWGTGLPRAQKVARYMAEEVAGALAEDRQVHVVHLGDIYYSGTDEEVIRHVLARDMWPVTVDQARAGVTSWSLNGNHDMYGGGHGYFKTLLGDERFSAQRSPDGKPTSWFRLSSPSWDIWGLDTSWDPDPLSLGMVGVLEEPQAEYVTRMAGESRRKLMLLSHHQLVSVYDKEDLGDTLPKKLAPVLDHGRLSAWLWGHEHRLMGFHAAGGVPFPRCIGHGGVPVLMSHTPEEPIPPPGAWQECGYSKYRGEHWGRMGFAILDFDGGRIDVRYRDEEGSTSPRRETIE